MPFVCWLPYSAAELPERENQFDGNANPQERALTVKRSASKTARAMGWNKYFLMIVEAVSGEQPVFNHADARMLMAKNAIVKNKILRLNSTGS